MSGHFPSGLTGGDFMRQILLPDGSTSMYSPAPSKSRYDFSLGMACSILVSVSGGIILGMTISRSGIVTELVIDRHESW
jgi:hypothetical protein